MAILVNIIDLDDFKKWIEPIFMKNKLFRFLHNFNVIELD